jgi:hypothetical protein
MLTVRSGRGLPLPPLTRVATVDEAVKVWLDFVQVAVTVSFKVVPLEAVTVPRIVTVHDLPPPSVPAVQVTRLFACEQVPMVLVRISPDIPFT